VLCVTKYHYVVKFNPPPALVKSGFAISDDVARAGKRGQGRLGVLERFVGDVGGAEELLQLGLSLLLVGARFIDVGQQDAALLPSRVVKYERLDSRYQTPGWRDMTFTVLWRREGLPYLTAPRGIIRRKARAGRGVLG
jgi:hypothetical protein